jgi:hypothetical protein
MGEDTKEEDMQEGERIRGSGSDKTEEYDQEEVRSDGSDGAETLPEHGGSEGGEGDDFGEFESATQAEHQESCGEEDYIETTRAAVGKHTPHAPSSHAQNGVAHEETDVPPAGQPEESRSPSSSGDEHEVERTKGNPEGRRVSEEPKAVRGGKEAVVKKEAKNGRGTSPPRQERGKSVQQNGKNHAPEKAVGDASKKQPAGRAKRRRHGEDEDEDEERGIDIQYSSDDSGGDEDETEESLRSAEEVSRRMLKMDRLEKFKSVLGFKVYMCMDKEVKRKQLDIINSQVAMSKSSGDRVNMIANINLRENNFRLVKMICNTVDDMSAHMDLKAEASRMQLVLAHMMYATALSSRQEDTPDTPDHFTDIKCKKGCGHMVKYGYMDNKKRVPMYPNAIHLDKANLDLVQSMVLLRKMDFVMIQHIRGWCAAKEISDIKAYKRGPMDVVKDLINYKDGTLYKNIHSAIQRAEKIVESWCEGVRKRILASEARQKADAAHSRPPKKMPPPAKKGRGSRESYGEESGGETASDSDTAGRGEGSRRGGHKKTSASYTKNASPYASEGDTSPPPKKNREGRHTGGEKKGSIRGRSSGKENGERSHEHKRGQNAKRSVHDGGSDSEEDRKEKKKHRGSSSRKNA